MSTEAAAVVLALVGVLAVLAVSWAFYRVGKAEERDRALQPPPPEPEPPAPPPAEPHAPGEARRRARPRPPRRPQA